MSIYSAINKIPEGIHDCLDFSLSYRNGIFAIIVFAFIAWAFNAKGRFLSLLAPVKKKGFNLILFGYFSVLYKLLFHRLRSTNNINEDWGWCYVILNRTSRSFSTVIAELPADIRDVVCLFYLVLRGLDTIEDDMKPSVEEKRVALLSFYTHLQQPSWNLKGFGTNRNEVELLHHFDRIIRCFMQIPKVYQNLIADICKEMGEGMSMFLNHPIETIEDWELYCYYVAGLVGCGLSKIFCISKLEDISLPPEEIKRLSICMGLFLQETNIIRDFLEDITDVVPRIFWPREIWGKYVDRVVDLSSHRYDKEALECLNEIITDILKHSLNCLEYLKCLKNESIFKFCAVPQVMAIATLSLCYNNYDIFLYNIKIPRTETIDIIARTKSFKDVLEFFKFYSEKIKSSVSAEKTYSKLLTQRLDDVISYCKKNIT